MASAKHLAIRPEILRPRYPIEYEENSSEYTSLGKAKVKVQSTWQYTPTLQDSWVYCKGLWGSCKTMIPKFHSAPPFLRWDAGAAEIQIPTLYQLLLDRPNLPQTPRVWRNNLMNFKNEDMSAMDPIRFTWNLFSFLDAEASLFPSPIVNDQRFSLLRMQDLKADVSAGHLSLPARQPQTYQRNTSKNIELSDAKSLKKTCQSTDSAQSSKPNQEALQRCQANGYASSSHELPGRNHTIFSRFHKPRDAVEMSPRLATHKPLAKHTRRAAASECMNNCIFVS